jgi:hypothetical protein
MKLLLKMDALKPAHVRNYASDGVRGQHGEEREAP